MAAFPQDRRGQILLLLTVAALVLGYFGLSGLSLVGLKGFKPLGLERDSLQREIDTLTAQVTRAKRDVATGTVQHLDERLAEFSASLALMRQLVPSRAEVPNLVDDITSRIKMRGATFAGLQPQAVESGTPFDTQRYRLTITGGYDQISEALTDISSLPRIIVPYDVHYQKVQGPAADTTRVTTILTATFAIRTYVKQAPDTTVARPPAAAPAARPAPGTKGGDE